MLSDDAASVHASLNERVLADEDAVANLERLEVRRDRAAADAHAVPEPSRQRAPHDTAHLRIEVGLSHGVPRRNVQHIVERPSPQVVGQRDLRRGIGFHRPHAMHRLDDVGGHTRAAADTADATVST